MLPPLSLMVSFLILSHLVTTNPSQHPHIRYTYLILVLALNRPTLHTIQHRRFDCCVIELSIQLVLSYRTKHPRLFSISTTLLAYDDLHMLLFHRHFYAGPKAKKFYRRPIQVVESFKTLIGKWCVITETTFNINS